MPCHWKFQQQWASTIHLKQKAKMRLSILNKERALIAEADCTTEFSSLILNSAKEGGYLEIHRFAFFSENRVSNICSIDRASEQAWNTNLKTNIMYFHFRWSTGYAIFQPSKLKLVWSAVYSSCRKASKSSSNTKSWFRYLFGRSSDTYAWTNRRSLQQNGPF